MLGPKLTLCQLNKGRDFWAGVLCELLTEEGKKNQCLSFLLQHGTGIFLQARKWWFCVAQWEFDAPHAAPKLGL